MGRLPLSFLATRPVFRLPRLVSSRRSASSPTGPARRHAGALDFAAIDLKWRSYLQNPAPRAWLPKFYICSMFPYPSGTLHMGHLRVYTISDVLSRFRRMQGFNVIHPMGWDAFGLPAENAAIEHGVDAKVWTETNIAAMKTQFAAMGVGFDWSREVTTCAPDYYEHTQRLFLMLHKNNLAYRAESMVNWDPVDGTVLANEQVSHSGHSWRSGALVEKKMLKQWFFKVTKFKKPLLEDLDLLRHSWPERVRTQQKNWIGKSEGSKIRFPVFVGGDGEVVEVFTTRADTLFGVQYLALSTSHSIVKRLAKTNAALATFIKEAEANRNLNKHQNSDGKPKKAFLLPGVDAQNPIAPKSGSLPVFVAEYVLEGYGSGAVMGVPGHDNKDYAFWRENGAGQGIKSVIRPLTGCESPGAFTHPGVLKDNCGEFTSLTSKQAKHAIVEKLHGKGGWAENTTMWKLRDWLVSRQRYWGAPIPMVHCGSCGVVPVKDEDLPVLLPEGVNISGKGGSPLANVKEWVETSCPSCGGKARRDTDTMDTFVDSSWYFMRFIDPNNKKEPFSKEKASRLLPVDIYIGGVEHALLHLLYARFFAKFARWAGLWPPSGNSLHSAEPFKRLITQGMVHGKTYSHPETGRFLKPEELSPNGTMLKDSDLIPIISFEKMSKSKHNGVDPAACISQYGADATRAHVLFQAPINDVLEWDEHRIIGIHRWFGKIWGLVHALRYHMRGEAIDTSDGVMTLRNKGENLLWRDAQSALVEVTTSLEDTYSLNTVVSTLIKLTNSLHSLHLLHEVPKNDKSVIGLQVRYRTTNMLLRMIAPIAPGFAEECWEALHVHLPDKEGTKVLERPWPKVDEVALEHLDEMIKCAVQVNGKVRLVIDVERRKVEDGRNAIPYLTKLVLETPEGKKWLGGEKQVQKAILPQGGRTINFVI